MHGVSDDNNIMTYTHPSTDFYEHAYSYAYVYSTYAAGVGHSRVGDVDAFLLQLPHGGVVVLLVDARRLS